jgi:hypothetical protein
MLVSLSHPGGAFNTSFDVINKSQVLAVIERWDFAG